MKRVHGIFHFFWAIIRWLRKGCPTVSSHDKEDFPQIEVMHFICFGLMRIWGTKSRIGHPWWNGPSHVTKHIILCAWETTLYGTCLDWLMLWTQTYFGINFYFYFSWGNSIPPIINTITSMTRTTSDLRIITKKVKLWTLW